MKKFYILIIFISISISNSFSQCDNFSVSLDAKDTKKIYDFSKNTEVTLYVSFNKNLYKKAYVEICQALGPRPVNYKKIEIEDSSAISMPVIYVNDSENQYLLIRISELNLSGQTFDSHYQCIDTIRILEGAIEKNKDAFWHKDITVAYAVNVENKRISNDLVSFDNKDLKVTTNNIVFTGNGLSTNCTVNDRGKQYEFWIRAEVKSNTESMDITIFPNAMKNIRNIVGIQYSDQIKDLSSEQRKQILDKFPEYKQILNKDLKFASIKMYKTDHVVVYTLTDQSGTHFTGADCAE